MAIILKFKGQEYTLPDDRAFEAGEAVEDIATLGEVLQWARKPQFHKMARCFAAVLRIAGARATDREVHAEMMAGFKAGQPGTHFAALAALMDVLMDGAPEGEGDAEGKAPAAS
jgi:hypothetical protein